MTLLKMTWFYYALAALVVMTVDFASVAQQRQQWTHHIQNQALP